MHAVLVVGSGLLTLSSVSSWRLLKYDSASWPYVPVMIPLTGVWALFAFPKAASCAALVGSAVSTAFFAVSNWRNEVTLDG